MRYTIFTAAAVPLLACATPAFAQDEAPAVGGAFVGVLVGYDSVSLDDGVSSASEKDLTYGITAGYDVGIGNSTFVGVEVEAADSEVGVTATDILVPGDSFTLGAGRELYVGARLGVHVVGQTQVYVKGGYVNGQLDAEYDDGVTVMSDEETLDGIRVGAGAEIGVGPAAVRVEYRYTTYGEVLDSGIDMTRHQIVAGAVGRF